MSIKVDTKKFGLEETLAVPQQYKDASSFTIRAFNTKLKNIDMALISIARTIGTMHQKTNQFSQELTNLSEIKTNLSSHKTIINKIGLSVKKTTELVTKKISELESHISSLESKISDLDNKVNQHTEMLNNIYTLLQQATAIDDDVEQKDQDDSSKHK